MRFQHSEHRNEKRCIEEDRANSLSLLVLQNHLDEQWERFTPLRSSPAEEWTQCLTLWNRAALFSWDCSSSQGYIIPHPPTMLVACTHKSRLSPSLVYPGAKVPPSNSGSNLAPVGPPQLFLALGHPPKSQIPGPPLWAYAQFYPLWPRCQVNPGGLKLQAHSNARSSSVDPGSRSVPYTQAIWLGWLAQCQGLFMTGLVLGQLLHTLAPGLSTHRLWY